MSLASVVIKCASCQSFSIRTSTNVLMFWIIGLKLIKSSTITTFNKLLHVSIKRFITIRLSYIPTNIKKKIPSKILKAGKIMMQNTTFLISTRKHLLKFRTAAHRGGFNESHKQTLNCNVLGFSHSCTTNMNF